MRKNIKDNYMTVIKDPIIRYQHRYLNKQKQNNQNKDYYFYALVDLDTDKVVIRDDYNKQIYRNVIENLKFRTFIEVSDEHTRSLQMLHDTI